MEGKRRQSRTTRRKSGGGGEGKQLGKQKCLREKEGGRGRRTEILLNLGTRYPKPFYTLVVLFRFSYES